MRHLLVNILFVFLGFFLVSQVHAAPKRHQRKLIEMGKYEYDNYDEDGVFVDAVPSRKLRRSIKTSQKKRNYFDELVREKDELYDNLQIAVDMVPQKPRKHKKLHSPSGTHHRKRKFFDDNHFFH
ncbi:hypothetical protein L596_029109 [Steinernema carpocapsae]|uniref:Uncharacterized protein n=1 Tax=Steinernema carpocapsae TaxID=34508 RepID=A0A4U5LTP2_STECR|nr:hypothetical protein L596_029109 [Steinernema carpocapsae]